MVLSSSPVSVSGFPSTLPTTKNNDDQIQNRPDSSLIAYDTECECFDQTANEPHAPHFHGWNLSKRSMGRNGSNGSTTEWNELEEVEEATPLTLNEFIEALPPILREQQAQKAGMSLDERRKMEEMRGTDDDPVNQLFRRLDLTLQEYKKYALFEPLKNYTRNLIATDHETFTLLLLCWNPDKESPIHDHPCDGCWLRVCEGEVREVRYEVDEGRDCLRVCSDETFGDGALAFINDFMGYHKVGNPSKTTPAITMHLYCPPFDKCKMWLDPNRASRSSNAYMCNYSEYGEKEACDFMAVNFI